MMGDVINLVNENKFCLSKKDMAFLKKLEKNVKNIYISYIAIAMCFMLVVAGLYIVTALNRTEGFIIAIFFSGIGLNLYFLSIFYKKSYYLITKLTKYIQGS